MGFLNRFFGPPKAQVNIPPQLREEMRRELREVVRRYAEVDRRTEMHVTKTSFLQRLFDWFKGK